MVIMKKLILFLFLVTTPVLAQQKVPDSAFMQRAMAVLQGQRNQALDQAADAGIRIAELTEELAKANARIKELESKKEEPK